MLSVGELSEQEVLALPFRQRLAVQLLLQDVRDGRVHPASSSFDLTPEQLLEEVSFLAWQRARESAARLRAL